MLKTKFLRNPVSFSHKTLSFSSSPPPPITPPQPKYSGNARAYTVQVAVSLAFIPKWRESWA